MDPLSQTLVEKSWLRFSRVLTEINDETCLQAQTTDAEWSLFSIEIQYFWAGQKNWVDKFWGIWGTLKYLINEYTRLTS